VSGYTPLFDSLTKGTLYGRWPDIGLWPIILSLSDKNGLVDVTQHYIAGVTGLGVDEVRACMMRFCEPDQGSRSVLNEGRRLKLVDSHRDWGWLIINHGIYREKARLEAKNAREIESGTNAERLRYRREKTETADDRRSNGVTADDRLQPPVTDPSNANADSNADSVKISPLTLPQDPNASGARDLLAPTHKGGNSSNKTGTRVPIPFPVSTAMQAWAEKETPTLDVTAATNEFIDYWKAVPGPKGRKLDWIATWRNRMRELHTRARVMGRRGAPSKPSPTTEELELRERNNADR